jgi:hypothetical protein
MKDPTTTITTDLTERKELFTRLLPEWEGTIAHLALTLLQTRVIDRGLLELSDVQQRLRFTMWRAVAQYKEDYKTKLSTWILKLLKQECSLLVESQYNCVPRDGQGNALFPLSLSSDLRQQQRDLDSPLYGKPITDIDIEDKRAYNAFEEVVEDSWFQERVKQISLILCKRKNLDERQIFSMILSDHYNSDKEIADEVGVNFAKVGEVRAKAKIALALLEGIPIRSFTRAKSAERLASRIRLIYERKHIPIHPTNK